MASRWWAIAIAGVLPLVPAAADAAEGAPAHRPVERAGPASIDHVIVNEVKIDAPGADAGHEWVEIRGPAGGGLVNLYLVSIDGDTGTRGIADTVVDLSPHLVGTNGMLFVGSNLPASPVTPPETTRVPVAGFTLENGSNSFMLISTTHGLTVGTDLDPDDDGDLDLTFGANVVDGVGVSDGGTSDSLYGAKLGSCKCHVGAATRFANATAPVVASAWFGGVLTGGGATEAYDLTQVTTNFPSGGALSPGAGNLPALEPAPWVLINEFEVDAPGIDGDHEWVEFRAPPGTDLSGWTFLSIDGDASSSGRADSGIDLNGVVAGTNGLVLAASNNDGAPVPPPETTFYDVGDTFRLENGTGSFMLFQATLAIGPDYDGNDDGILEIPPAFVRDGIAWGDQETSSIDWAYTVVVDYMECNCVPDAAVRFPRMDAPTNTFMWYWGDLTGPSDTTMFGGARSDFFPIGGELTPGRPNVPAPTCDGLTATMWGDGDITGTSGRDVIVGYGSDQEITPGGGSDAVCAGGGDDVVRDGPGNDAVFGEEGDDRFVSVAGTAGQDVFHGGPDADTADYSARVRPLVIWPNGAADDGSTGELDNVDFDVEHVIGGSGRDVLRGSGGANHLEGRTGNDVLDGQGGDDLLEGGDGIDTMMGGPGDDQEFGGTGNDSFDTASTTNGADVLDGGGGTDTVTYATRTAPVTVTLDDDQSGDGAAGEGDEIRFVEILRGTGLDDTITGGVGADQLIGGEGSDHLHGGGGADSIVGLGGNDVMGGEGGNDVVVGGANSDILTGGPGADQLLGGPASDYLDSQDGAPGDTVDGGAGLDNGVFDVGDVVDNVP